MTGSLNRSLSNLKHLSGHRDRGAVENQLLLISTVRRICPEPPTDGAEMKVLDLISSGRLFHFQVAATLKARDAMVDFVRGTWRIVSAERNDLVGKWSTTNSDSQVG